MTELPRRVDDTSRHILKQPVNGQTTILDDALYPAHGFEQKVRQIPVRRAAIFPSGLVGGRSR